jgi:hypothetical protein
MNRLARAPIVAAWLVVMCVPAVAQNWIGLLKNTPAENFTEEDEPVLRTTSFASSAIDSETAMGRLQDTDGFRR